MIEAIIGLVGVLVGSVITVSKEIWIRFIERRRSGSFAAMRVVSVLDQFVETCVDVVHDDGTSQGRPAGRTKDGEEYHDAQIDPPKELIFPEDIDWECIGGELMFRALALPNELKQANRYINFEAEHSFPPDFAEFFSARHRTFAEMGLEAAELSRLLRAKYNIPAQTAPSWNPDWSAEAFFKKRKQEIEERQQREFTPPVLDEEASAG